jgi:hypothetical protein
MLVIMMMLGPNDELLQVPCLGLSEGSKSSTHCYAP